MMKSKLGYKDILQNLEGKYVFQYDFLFFLIFSLNENHTGKSLSGALIFASTDSKYDDRVFKELQVIHENSKLKPGGNMLCTEIVADIKNNFCTNNMFSPCSA